MIANACLDPEYFNEMACWSIKGRTALLKIDYWPYLPTTAAAAEKRRLNSKIVALRFMDSPSGFQWHISEDGGAFEPSYRLPD